MPPADPVPVSPLVGLGTLQALKNAVLPQGMTTGTTFDAQLTAIGLSVAAQFDAFTARTLARNVGVQWEGTADRIFVALPCFPVESLSLLELRFYGQTDDGTLTGNPVWNDFTSFVVGTLDNQNGLLDLQYPQGTVLDRLRVTYTGGYYIPGTPSADGLSVPAMPETATQLPGDLFNAWTLQVATELQARDILGTGAIRDEKEASSSTGYAQGLSLKTAVLQILNTYRRLAVC